MIKSYKTYLKEDLDYEEEEDYDDDYFITDNDFKQFLVDRNCYYEYVANVMEWCKNNQQHMDQLIQCFEKGPKADYISMAFDWAGAQNFPEGADRGDFWSNLSAYWERLVFQKGLERLEYKNENY